MQNLAEKQRELAEIIWQEAPISSRKLTEICEKKIGWKRTTTYTMLKGLCEKGIFENKNGVVVAILSKEEYGASLGKEIVKNNFDNSLPRFLVAFTKQKKLSENEIAELQKLIDEYKEA